MKFEVNGAEVDLEVRRLIIAGFTARDREAVLAHLEEIKDLGVELPDVIPALYPSIASRISQSTAIQAPTPATSGEAEVVLVHGGDRLYIALGSDHTERSSEGVALVPSKSVCDKPISRHMWTADEVWPHLAQLQLTCDVRVDGTWAPYQAGLVAEFMDLDELTSIAEARAGWGPGDVLMCGTLPTIPGGMVYGDAFRMSLVDPVLSRELTLEYDVELISVDDSSGEASSAQA